MNKEGSTIAGLMDTVAILTSVGLQYGVPLKAFSGKIMNNKFDPRGIVFQGHPNLKHIFCTDDFPGHAFRKDFPLENDEEYLLEDIKSPEDYGIARDLPS